MKDAFKKMETNLQDVVQYTLKINGIHHKMNEYIGNQIKIEWSGSVICSCGKKMKNFYSSGFCYKCFWESPLASKIRVLWSEKAPCLSLPSSVIRLCVDITSVNCFLL